MDFENDDSPEQYETPASASSQPQPRQMPPVQTVFHEYPRKKRSFLKVFFGFFFSMSVVANLFLFIMVIFLAVLLTGAGDGFYEERTIKEGTTGNRIAVINIQGVIQSQVSEDIRKQLQAATKDRDVKAVIVRIVSPGGTVSASDQIHHEITKYRQATGKPVVAFMQTVAASGGYYSAVACNEIVAEPTVITGSIGVIMNNFVIKELLEEKLGIKPVTIKSGEKKDWPSSFTETTQEQIDYLQEKLIGPAYERFVNLIVQGRETVLTESEVYALADGSIYSADEALDNKLIDEVGYIETAIAAAERLAGVSGSEVFEYKHPLSFISILSGQSKSNSILPIDKKVLSDITTPQLLYIWDTCWY